LNVLFFVCIIPVSHPSSFHLYLTPNKGEISYKQTYN